MFVYAGPFYFVPFRSESAKTCIRRNEDRSFYPQKTSFILNNGRMKYGFGVRRAPRHGNNGCIDTVPLVARRFLWIPGRISSARTSPRSEGTRSPISSSPNLQNIWRHVKCALIIIPITLCRRKRQHGNITMDLYGAVPKCYIVFFLS